MQNLHMETLRLVTLPRHSAAGGQLPVTRHLQDERKCLLKLCAQTRNPQSSLTGVKPCIETAECLLPQLKVSMAAPSGTTDTPTVREPQGKGSHLCRPVRTERWAFQREAHEMQLYKHHHSKKTLIPPTHNACEHSANGCESHSDRRPRRTTALHGALRSCRGTECSL